MYVKQGNAGVSQVHCNHLLLRPTFLRWVLEAQDYEALPGAEDRPGPGKGIRDPPGSASVGRRQPQLQLALPPATF